MGNAPRTLYITASHVEVGINERRKVSLRLHYPEGDTGLVPDLRLGIELTPEEARHLAQALLRKADEVQDG